MFTTEEGAKPMGSYFGVPGVNASFDYVVVGGGNTGLALAARLAEEGDLSIAIVEAGGFYEIENGVGSVLPGLANIQYSGSSPEDSHPTIDWNFVTEAQAGVNQRHMRYARGKTLGGTSARHYNVYHRGTMGFYQRWADLTGDTSFTMPNLLPFFKKSIKFTPPNAAARAMNGINDGSIQYDSAAFGSEGGPLNVTWGNWVPGVAAWFEKALTAVGIPPNPSNLNSGILSGSAWPPATINPVKMERDSSKTSFLDTALRNPRANIKVYPRTHATRIIFDEDRRAIGVSVTTEKTTFTLSGKREILLCAGAFQSPQLLMCSGIGPAATLNKHSIPVLADLPAVGSGWQDHPAFAISYRFKDQTSSRMANDPAYAAAAMEEYVEHKTGPLTATCAIIAFEKLPADSRAALSREAQTALASFPEDWPEVEYIIGDGHKGWGHNYKTADPKDGYNYASLTAALVAPLSRGTVSIRSADATDAPVLDPSYLTHPADNEVALAAFKRLRAMGDWMRDNGATIGDEYFPGRETVRTDEEIMEYIRNSLQTVYHATSTCAMGKEGSREAVVDTRCKVFGVKALRVVDASVFPLLSPGHPQAGAYMIAEKVADDVKRGLKPA